MDIVPKETKSAGGVVLNSEGEILIVNQKGTSWSLPKGHLENDEDAITAAKREIYEESGIIDLQFVRELGTYKRYRLNQNGGDDKTEMKTITFFLFKTDQTSLKPIDPENPEARWAAKDEVGELLTHEKDKEFFLSLNL